MRMMITESELELLENVLDDWTRQEKESIDPRYDLLDGLEEVRFRSIDIPRRYREDEPWKTDTESVQTFVYALQEELGRDAVPREVGFGHGDVVETSTEYNTESESLEQLHNDVAGVAILAHQFGWTLQDFDEDRIFLKPARNEVEVDDL